MRIARRILLLAAMLLVATVAAGWRAADRRSFEHWFRHIPVIGDVRVSGVRGTLFVAVRREVDSGVSSPSGRFGNAEKNWGFSWQSAVTMDFDREPPDYAPARQETKRAASLAASVEPRWVRIDLVGVPFWSALVSSVLLVIALEAPEVVGPWMRRRRRRGGSCGACGYDLTGNESGVCPECGSSSSGLAAVIDDGRGGASAAARVESSALPGE